MPFSPAPSKFYAHHASPVAPTDIMMNANEFIKDKLYFVSVQREPQQYSNVHFFTIDNTLIYINFYADFGPLNIAHVMRFCGMLNEKLQNPALVNKKICLYSSMDRAKRANAAYLMCAYMVIVLKMTPEEAYAPFANASPPFVHFRDAGYGAATYHLSVLDCIQGLYKGITLGLYHIDNYDLEEYEFYEKVENGDMNWITNKFIALASPKDDPPGTSPGGAGQRQGLSAYTNSFFSAGLSSVSGGGAMATTQRIQKSPMGNTLSSAYRMDDLIRFLKERGVCTIVRLNNNVYDRKRFIEAGIEHIDLYFPDGSTPPEGILKRFLDLCESRRGVIAVHCKAGLGRTGSLIGSYLMKHYKMTASECISFLRILRPGSVVGPQQNWLESMQTKLWKMNPVTKLSASVSLLRPSTFETSVRFYFPQLENLISKKSSDNDTNSSSDDLSRRADTYSNDDFMNGKFHTPEESDMEAEMESIESQFEDFYKQEYEREIHRNHHRRAHHGSHHGAAVGGSAVNNNMSSSSSPSSTPTGGKNSRTSPSVATGASARSSPTSVSNNNSNNNNNAMRSLFVAPNDTAMEMQLEADGGFDIKPFNMEEYVIPVQPRKGKRNVATAAAAVASGVIDVDEKPTTTNDGWSRPQTRSTTTAAASDNNHHHQQQQQNYASTQRYQAYASAIQQIAAASQQQSPLPATTQTMSGFVLKGVTKPNTPATAANGATNNNDVDVKSNGMVPNNAGRVNPASKKPTTHQ